MVEQLKVKCEEQGIPYVFSLKRWILGQILLKKVPVSCVGVISHEGSEEHTKELLDLIREERAKFQKLNP